MMKGKTPLLLLVLAVFVAFSSLIQAQEVAENEFRLPEREDNAALNYLLASVELRAPQTTANAEAIKLTTSKLYKLPPAALAACPDAVNMLRFSAGSIRALHEGAQKPRCAFDVDWQAGPGVILPHLAEMRNLARRSIAIAKYAEFDENPVQAAQIYGDVMRMSAHLAEEPLIISGLVGISVQSMAASAIESLLTREPDGDAIRELLSGLQKVPSRAFRCDIYFRSEAEMFGNWFLRDPQRNKRELVNVMGAFPKSEAAKRLAEASADDLRAWVLEYQEVMNRTADAVSEPYYKSIKKVPAEKARVEKMMAQFNDDPTQGNPLIGLLLPVLWRCHGQFAIAEARLGMLQLLCAAQLHKTRTGKYPAALAELKPYFQEGAIPRDPVTGKDFLYTLKQGTPRIECQAPEDLKQTHQRDCYFDLAERLEKDEDALKKFREEIKSAN